MGWTLGRREPEESESLLCLFTELGRALYLATEFEEKCLNFLRIMNYARELETGTNYDAALELVNRMRTPTLGNAVRNLNNLLGVSDQDTAALDGAREARNFIAHEAAKLGSSLGPNQPISETTISSCRTRLHERVVKLADGDNVVSRWWYEIEHKQPAPSSMVDLYSSRIEEWVFGGSSWPK